MNTTLKTPCVYMHFQSSVFNLFLPFRTEFQHNLYFQHFCAIVIEVQKLLSVMKFYFFIFLFLFIGLRTTAISLTDLYNFSCGQPQLSNNIIRPKEQTLVGLERLYTLLFQFNYFGNCIEGRFSYLVSQLIFK